MIVETAKLFCRSLFVFLSLFLLAITLSVLQFTDSDYLFAFFKLFLYDNRNKGNVFEIRVHVNSDCVPCSVTVLY
jgi:hypothetical protein